MWLQVYVADTLPEDHPSLIRAALWNPNHELTVKGVPVNSEQFTTNRTQVSLRQCPQISLRHVAIRNESGFGVVPRRAKEPKLTVSFSYLRSHITRCAMRKHFRGRCSLSVVKRDVRYLYIFCNTKRSLIPAEQGMTEDGSFYSFSNSGLRTVGTGVTYEHQQLYFRLGPTVDTLGRTRVIGS